MKTLFASRMRYVVVGDTGGGDRDRLRGCGRQRHQCAELAPRTTTCGPCKYVSNTSSSSKVDTKTVTATCPSGKAAIGGGADINRSGWASTRSSRRSPWCRTPPGPAGGPRPRPGWPRSRGPSPRGPCAPTSRARRRAAERRRHQQWDVERHVRQRLQRHRQQWDVERDVERDVRHAAAGRRAGRPATAPAGRRAGRPATAPVERRAGRRAGRPAERLQRNVERNVERHVRQRLQRNVERHVERRTSGERSSGNVDRHVQRRVRQRFQRDVERDVRRRLQRLDGRSAIQPGTGR